MNQSPQYLIKLLLQRGYLFKRDKGSHHVYFHPELRKTIIVPVHGNRDIPTGTFRAILRQAGISKDEI